MTCILCDSWGHNPVNPKTKHPRPRAQITDADVESALLTGFMWGTQNTVPKDTLCPDHSEMVAEMKTRLGLQ